MYSQHYSHLLLFGNAEQMKTTASCLIIQSAEPFVWLSAVQSGATHRPDEVRDGSCQNTRNINCGGEPPCLLSIGVAEPNLTKRRCRQGSTCASYFGSRGF